MQTTSVKPASQLPSAPPALLVGRQQPQRRPPLAYGRSMAVVSLTAQVNANNKKKQPKALLGTLEVHPGEAAADL